MPDEQDRAEALDDEGHDADYPPDEPMGVEDPTQDDRVEDSIDERAERELSEQWIDDADRPVVRPYVDEDEALLDDEAELIGDAEIGGRDREADAAPDAAEEAALHLDEE